MHAAQGQGVRGGQWQQPHASLHGSAVLYGHRVRRRCVVATRARAQPQDTALLSLPLFPLPTVCHPTQSGVIVVYEPRYRELFRTQQQQQQQQQQASQQQPGPAGGAPPQFGHILAGSAAPPVMMEAAVGGLPPLGVAAAVKGIEELPNGQLQVQYVGLRRFQLLSVDNESKAYAVAAATWLDDVAPAAPAAAALTDTLELDVFRLLQQVAKYSQQLAAASASNPSSSGAGSSSSSSSPAQPQVLPEAVFMYAPPPPTKQSVAQYLTNAGVPAGQRIATWQRMGSVYDGDTGGKEKPTADPYQVVRDSVGKERRQELFSFAAASVLELGLPERLALLQCQDTAARLQFVAAAVQPHLQDLVARVSVQQALVK